MTPQMVGLDAQAGAQQILYWAARIVLGALAVIIALVLAWKLIETLPAFFHWSSLLILVGCSGLVGLVGTAITGNVLASVLVGLGLGAAWVVYIAIDGG